MATAKLTSKGQITIPQEVRADLGVGPGDKMDFVRMEDGNYAVMAASRSIKSLKGVIPRPRKPVTVKDMDAAIASGARGE